MLHSKFTLLVISTESLSLSTLFKTNSTDLYQAWLDSAKHSAFTGGEANIRNEVHSTFSAWNEYISGKILELQPCTRILQSWRTLDFNEDDEDSLLEILLEDLGNGHTKFTLNHSKLPIGGAKKYSTGWQENYLEPMHQYFNRLGTN